MFIVVLFIIKFFCKIGTTQMFFNWWMVKWIMVYPYSAIKGNKLLIYSMTSMSLQGFSLVQFSSSVVSNSLQSHGLQHARPPCPSPTPRVYSNSYPLSRWCHPTISSSIISFSSCLQSFPASESFQMSQLFASGGQSIGVSASTSVLLMYIQVDFL